MTLRARVIFVYSTHHHFVCTDGLLTNNRAFCQLGSDFDLHANRMLEKAALLQQRCLHPRALYRNDALRAIAHHIEPISSTTPHTQTLTPSYSDTSTYRYRPKTSTLGHLKLSVALCANPYHFLTCFLAVLQTRTGARRGSPGPFAVTHCVTFP